MLIQRLNQPEAGQLYLVGGSSGLIQALSCLCLHDTAPQAATAPFSQCHHVGSPGGHRTLCRAQAALPAQPGLVQARQQAGPQLSNQLWACIHTKLAVKHPHSTCHHFRLQQGTKGPVGLPCQLDSWAFLHGAHAAAGPPPARHSVQPCKSLSNLMDVRPTFLICCCSSCVSCSSVIRPLLRALAASRSSCSTRGLVSHCVSPLASAGALLAACAAPSCCCWLHMDTSSCLSTGERRTGPSSFWSAGSRFCTCSGKLWQCWQLHCAVYDINP